MQNNLNVLLINPWIHDFAAYDFWAKPMGILILASILRNCGAKVTYIDCLARFYCKINNLSCVSNDGKGSFLKKKIKKPKVFSNISKNFSRYGINPYWFERDLKRLKYPDIILITSIIAYWYPGVKETILRIRKIYPKIPIIVGGIYPSLYKKHAIEKLGADYVVTGAGETIIISLISKLINWIPKINYKWKNTDSYRMPAFDIQNKIEHIPILSSRGCPYTCMYCASNFLQVKRIQRKASSIKKEIIYWYKKFKVKNFVFYDDALLVNSRDHVIKILKKNSKFNTNICFYIPNAIHANRISNEMAKLIYKVNFCNIRLGFETGNFSSRKDIDTKITPTEFVKSVKNLIKSGFNKKEIEVYLLIGLPNQSINEIIKSVNFILEIGAKPVLSQYSPIANTFIWKKALSTSKYDLKADPILTNNSVFPCSDIFLLTKILSNFKKIKYVKK